VNLGNGFLFNAKWLNVSRLFFGKLGGGTQRSSKNQGDREKGLHLVAQAVNLRLPERSGAIFKLR
jgi:hypothetical protein